MINMILFLYSINDYHSQTSEANILDLNDIVRMHDINRDYAAGNIESFQARSEKTFRIVIYINMFIMKNFFIIYFSV